MAALLAALVLTLTTQVSPAPEPGLALVHTPLGYRLVMNQPPVHFTLDLLGQELQRAHPELPMWDLDGQVVQLVFAPAEPALGRGASRLPPDALLLRHAEWERAYLAQQAGGARVKLAHGPYRTPGGRRCLAWELPMPGLAVEGLERPVVTTLFLTTVHRGHVVGVSSPVLRGQSVAAARRKLELAMNSLVTHDGPISLAAESERARHGGR